VPGPARAETWESGTGVLASPPAALRAARNARGAKADFDILIIGSGYGGAVCAARLAAQRRPGVKIGLLERGREWVPGTFPDRLSPFNLLLPFSRRPSWLREQLSDNRLGLFGFHEGDVQVVVGSGLGGSSLTNCAVALETEEDVFRQAAWPEELRSKDVLRPYYALAHRMLSPEPTPEDRFTLKLRTHLGTASTLQATGEWPPAKAYRVPLAITHAARTNAVGMRQHGCVQCGDCATGCNVGAKNSLDMNYLPLAWTKGVMMFPQVEVSTLQKVGDRYQVDYVLRPDTNRPNREELGSLTASIVVVAAGTMGTTAILLRSQGQGLAMSSWLGKGFSGNGNYLGFVDYQYTDPTVYTDTRGVGVAGGTPRYPVGAYIEGIIDFRSRERTLERRVIIEDIAHASPLAGGVALLMLADLDRAMTLLGCGHDRAEGEIRLEHDIATVHWRDYERQPSHAELARLMDQYAGAYGGKFRPFTPARNYTAHPLGGCRMGASAARGVVNHRGQVFDPSSGEESRDVHAGLYVADASIVPTALGSNPLLTITALAERIAELIASDPRHGAYFRPGR
jgi:cholesterol oxidase